MRPLCNLRLWAPLVVGAFAACGVDDRPLSYEFHALEAAGASSGGANNAGSGVTPEAGSAADGGDGALAGARASDAGAPASAAAGAAEAGAPSGGHSSSEGSAGEAAARGGSGSGGSAGMQDSGGNTGEGGSAPSFPCGDLNHDLVDDCTQTLVQNSRFDTAATGWDAEPLLTETWNASNASGKPGSGSLALTHTGAGGTMLAAHQCIPVLEQVSYDVAARVMLSAGSGKAGVNLFLFDDAACQGNLIAGHTPIQGGVVGQWTDLHDRVWITGGVHSAYVRLFADKPSNQQSLSVLIDDVLITRAPGG